MSGPLATPDRTRSRLGEPTWEIAYLFPEQGAWSEDAYLALKADRLVEYDEGCLEFHAMPTPAHQLIVAYLYETLKAFVAAQALGRVLFAPLPVRLWPGKYREPDVVFLRHERIRSLREQPDGADLVVEVVSPGDENRERDLVTKPGDYARAGVQEYWIVDPEQREIKVLALDGTAYREHGTFKPGDSAPSLLLGGFAVDVTAVFAAGEELG